MGCYFSGDDSLNTSFSVFFTCVERIGECCEGAGLDAAQSHLLRLSLSSCHGESADTVVAALPSSPVTQWLAVIRPVNHSLRPPKKDKK